MAKETAKKLDMGANILDAASLGDSKKQETAEVAESIEKAEREIRKDEVKAEPKPEDKSEPQPEAKAEPQPKPKRSLNPINEPTRTARRACLKGRR